jgi:hypothetical protein
MSDFIAFVRFAFWTLRINVCDWLPGGGPSKHYGWCGVHGDVPEILDERWWDWLGWRSPESDR